MRYESSGSTFHARVDGFDTGLTGTIGVRILDDSGAIVTARATAGIIENPAGSGSYLATLVAPIDGGEYTIFWDSGSVTPGTTAGEQLSIDSPFSPAPPAPGDLFASNDELGDRLGITLNSSEQSRADRLLATASDLIRARVKQHVTLVEADTWVTRGVYGNRLRAPQRPIVSVASVTAAFMGADPVTIAPATYFVDRDELVRYDWPLSFTIGNGWLGPGWELTITYDHGYDPDATPAPYQLALCKTVALEAVTRVWVNPAAAKQTAVGGVQEAYPAVGLMLTDEEEADLADAFRMTAGSVTLR